MSEHKKSYADITRELKGVIEDTDKYRKLLYLSKKFDREQDKA